MSEQDLHFLPGQISSFNVGLANDWGVIVQEKQPKLLNGRYEKVKKLGEGAYNVVYLAKDLMPSGQSRLLSQHHLDLVGQLPIENPYKSKHSYFDDEPEETEEVKAAKAQLR